MRRIAPLALATLLALPACGDDGGETPLSVPLPTTTTKANNKVGAVWTELGEADWTCLDTPTSDAASMGPIMLSGVIDDFQSDDPVGAATITAFPGIMTTGNAGMATSSDVVQTRGQFAMNLMQLPAGETRFGQVLSGYPLERSKIEHFGFIIANKKAETFKLELDWIRAF